MERQSVRSLGFASNTIRCRVDVDVGVCTGDQPYVVNERDGFVPRRPREKEREKERR